MKTERQILKDCLTCLEKYHKYSKATSKDFYLTKVYIYLDILGIYDRMGYPDFPQIYTDIKNRYYNINR